MIAIAPLEYRNQLSLGVLGHEFDVITEEFCQRETL